MTNSYHPDELTLPRLPNASFGDRATSAFTPALIGAGLIHLIAILMMPLAPPRPAPIPETALEVLILHETGRATSQPSPDAALSRHTRAGESPRGDAAMTIASDDARRPDTESAPTASHAMEETRPEIVPDRIAQPQPPVAQKPITQKALEEAVSWEAPTVLAARVDAKPDHQPLPDPMSPRPTLVDTGRILASQGMEIARLTASLEARASNYASRVRRKSISASTREFRYASYLGAWARKVERIGNLNYPQAAKEQQLYGSLILHVAVRADGSVEGIRVVRSSGFDLLDQAAIQIVELAAPYSPFPPDIAAETDVLDIIRTWQFMRGGVLGWER